MPKFETISARIALAAAAVDQHPEKLDAQRVEDVALAIARMVPAQQDRLIDLAKHGTDALFSEIVTVQHLVNDVRRDRVEANGGQFFEAFLNPGDVLRGLRYFLVKRDVGALDAKGRETLEASLASRDVSATAALLERLGLDTGPAHWITRVAASFPNKDGVGVVGVRGRPTEQIGTLEEVLRETLGALASVGGDREALRARAADAFAGLMTASLMLGKREQNVRPDLAAWFERLAEQGVTGFLPKERTLARDVPMIGETISTKLRFTPEMQILGLTLQLGPAGDGLDLASPSGDVVIPVGNDERYLGQPGAPFGLVVDGHVVVPRSVEAEIYLRTMGTHERKLGFGELPDGPFRIRTAHRGTALRLPISVEVGGARFELRHGRYGSDSKGAEVAGGRPITLSANGERARIDPATGEVTR